MLFIVITQMPTEWPRIHRKTRTIHTKERKKEKRTMTTTILSKDKKKTKRELPLISINAFSKGDQPSKRTSDRIVNKTEYRYEI